MIFEMIDSEGFNTVIIKNALSILAVYCGGIFSIAIYLQNYCN